MIQITQQNPQGVVLVRSRPGGGVDRIREDDRQQLSLAYVAQLKVLMDA
jgi:hypothetical protein